MTNTWQRVSLIAFVSTLAQTVSAQPESAQPVPPQPSPGPNVAPAPEPVPVEPMTSAPPTTYSPEAPAAAPTYYDVPRTTMKRAGPDVGRLMFAFDWGFALPIGSVHQFTSNISALGFDLRFRYWLTQRITLGITADWQTLTDERPRTTYQVANGAVTATTHNSAQVGTISAAGEFYFIEEGTARPYVGASIGFGWTNFQAVAADLAYFDDKSSIALGGELGVLFTFSPAAPRLLVGGRYSFQPSADFLAVNDVQQITLMVGVASP
jgi:hypothetical protein